MGFLAAIHTSGAYPNRLASLLPSLSWVGLDIKAPRRRYASVTGVEASGDKAWKSLELLLESGVPYELRVTVDPTVLTGSDVEELILDLDRAGAQAPVLQEARAEGTRPEYAAKLAALRLADVVPEGLFPGVERRVASAAKPAPSSIREALSARDGGAAGLSEPPI
jgi:pyruvate formate lyase activating enzyme